MSRHQEKIWETYQNDPALQAMGCRDGGRITFIASLIPSNARVLNVGVGRGTLERLLVNKGVEMYSLDPSQTSINSIRQQIGIGENAQVGYSQSMPYPSNKFEYVIMTEVLEHLADDVLEETRAEVRRVLRPGGVFLGSVPADENLIEGIVICPCCGNRFHRWGHMQSFSKPVLENYLREEFDNVSVTRKFLAELPSLNWKGKISALARKVQAKMGSKGANQSFVFFAQKSGGAMSRVMGD